MTLEAVGQELQVDPAKGLSTAEAQQRLQQYGPNHLAEKKKEPGWQAFLRQYQDLMQYRFGGRGHHQPGLHRRMGYHLGAAWLDCF